MQEQLNRIESMLAELLKRTEPKTRPKKQIDTRTLEEQLAPFIGITSPRELEKFISYWSEGNRWKKEKTWEVEKRLKRWMMNVEDRNFKESQRFVKVEEKPVHREIKSQNYSEMISIGDLFGNRV